MLRTYPNFSTSTASIFLRGVGTPVIFSAISHREPTVRLPVFVTADQARSGKGSNGVQ